MSPEQILMAENIVFFDGECPLCHRAVRHIIEIDQDRKINFAPLSGETARKILSGPQESLTQAQSLVFVENVHSTQRQFYVRSRAIFRIYWVVGHGWGLLGILSFLPCWLTDLLYRWVAAHRHQFRLRIPTQPGPQDRFLP